MSALNYIADLFGSCSLRDLWPGTSVIVDEILCSLMRFGLKGLVDVPSQLVADDNRGRAFEPSICTAASAVWSLKKHINGVQDWRLCTKYFIARQYV